MAKSTKTKTQKTPGPEQKFPFPKRTTEQQNAAAKCHKIKLRKDTPKYYFDYPEADRVCRFFESNLVHVEDPHYGKPFKLEAWQRTVLEDVFGWKRRKSGKRRYRTVYIEVPRKNGKSTFGAGIAIYLLVADRERGAQIVSAAADKDQAGIIFELASKMIEASPKLSEYTGVFRRTIAYYRDGNKYTVLSADAHTKHGKNLHGILFDELHTQPNRHLVDVLHTSRGTRLQPLEIFMTTAGYDRTSICYEKHDYAKKVRDGLVVDDEFYPVIYAADEKDDWTDPKIWKKANPNLGVTILREYLEKECKDAQEIPAYENTFRRLHLNQWTEQESRMIPMHLWAQNGKHTVIEEELEGKECFCGLDLASTTDIASFCMVFPIEKSLKILPYFFVPSENMPSRYKKNPLANYPEWAKRGKLIATEGNVIDYDVLKNFILEKWKKFNIRGIAFDRWNATQLTQQLDGAGLKMEPFGQGFQSMNAPTNELLKRLLANELHHGNHPVLTWMASNVAAETDSDQRIKPSKKRSKEKIDGIVATVMGIGLMILQEAEQKSVYEERGLISF